MKSAQMQKNNVTGKLSQAQTNATDVTGQELALHALLADTSMLSQAAAEGKLATRADASKHQGIYAEIVRGMNATLDAIIGPLNVAAHFVDQIGKGEIPARITDTYNGDFNTIKSNLNSCVDGLGGLVEAHKVLQLMAVNDYTARVEGSYKGVFGELAKATNLSEDRSKNVVKIVENLGKGDYKNDRVEVEKIGRRSENDALIPALAQAMGALDAMVAEMARLTEASKEGQLSDRGKPEQFQGAYAEIVRGVNTMLDTILLPIGEGNRILAQVSNGKIDELIAQTYKGDHEKMKQAINNVASVVQSLHKELARLTEASKEGQLSERGKPEQFKGAYAEIVRGVNTMLDAILLPIGEGNRILAQVSNGKIDELIAQTYKGDHEKMKQAINNIAVVLQSLQKEMARLTDASKEGQLSDRGKPEQFQGAYAEIVRGVNTMLDAILLPIGEGNRILSLIRGGNLREKVEVACKGDHAKMKDAVNGVHGWLTELIAYATKIANGDMTATMAKASDADQIHEWLILMRNNINAVATDANLLGKAATEGKLAIRADAAKHSGEYRKIVEGFNGTLDAVIIPLNMAAKYVDQISQGEVPVKITDTYNGDFNNIKNNLNACIDGLGGLVEANEVLQLMAANDYTSRVQGSYKGVFAEVGKATNQTADTIRGSMETLGQNVEALSSAAEELSATSQQMSANAEETSAQTKVVSTATLQVSQNLQTVATGSEEMGASIKEIAKNATEAAKVATSAVKVAETANTTVSKLGDSSTEIGQVIKVITSIAQQTNLLALNATIEAARAGEAGKGFAVVANEVKELAKETAKATEDISRKIEAIQTDTKAAVSAIGTISEVINQINGISNTIATAVEEQNATTNEMARNVSEAARGSGEITSNIGGVAEAAQSTSRGAADTQKAAAELSKMSTQLRDLVDQFKIKSSDSGAATHAPGKAASHAVGAR